MKLVYSYQDVIFMRFAAVGIRRAQFSDNFALDSWKHCKNKVTHPSTVNFR